MIIKPYHKQGGFSLPLIIILTLFIVAPLSFWFFSYKNSSNNVKGISDIEISKGIVLKITSKKGTWDLYEYLCKEGGSCVKIETISGGETYDQNLAIEAVTDWKEYDYIKLYVDAGWGSEDRSFYPKNLSGNQNVKVNESQVVIPIEELFNGVLNHIVFSD